MALRLNGGSVRLRDASVEGKDAEAIADIYETYVTMQGCFTLMHDKAPSAGEWRARIASFVELGGVFIVAVVADTDEVIGFACCKQYLQGRPLYATTMEHSVYIAPEHTGRGIGKGLMQDLIKRLKLRGIRMLIAVIADPDSARFHRNIGFRYCGTLYGTGRKWGKWADTAIMQLDLAQSDFPPKGDFKAGNAALTCEAATSKWSTARKIGWGFLLVSVVAVAVAAKGGVTVNDLKKLV